MTGEQATLKVGEQKRKEVYPEEVEGFARECWIVDASIPEPSKHQRPESAAVDSSGETIPQRLQTLTNDEAYQVFEDSYSGKVRNIMKSKCDAMRAKHSKETTYNKTVNKRLDVLEEKFPSKQWFINRKPKETRVNNDHTTGLCKDCYSAKCNYETLLKQSKSTCQCKTQNCPNWNCLCNDEEDCQCDPVCSCDDCTMCQVGKVLIITLKMTIIGFI